MRLYRTTNTGLHRLDMTNININDEHAEKLDPASMPDLVIVKKSFRDKRKKHNKRNWKIKILDKEIVGSGRRDELQAECAQYYIIAIYTYNWLDVTWSRSCKIWRRTKNCARASTSTEVCMYISMYVCIVI